MIRVRGGDAMGILDGELRLSSAAQPHEGHAAVGIRTIQSTGDLVKDVASVDKMGVAGKADESEWLRRWFWG